VPPRHLRKLHSCRKKCARVRVSNSTAPTIYNLEELTLTEQRAPVAGPIVLTVKEPSDAYGRLNSWAPLTNPRRFSSNCNGTCRLKRRAEVKRKWGPFMALCEHRRNDHNRKVVTGGMRGTVVCNYLFVNGEMESFRSLKRRPPTAR